MVTEYIRSYKEYADAANEYLREQHPYLSAEGRAVLIPGDVEAGIQMALRHFDLIFARKGGAELDDVVMLEELFGVIDEAIEQQKKILSSISRTYDYGSVQRLLDY